MSILYDLSACQAVGSTKMHGGGMYAKIVFKKLLQYTHDVAIIYNSSYYMDETLYELIDKYNIETFDLNKVSLQTVIHEHAFEIFYSALPYSYTNIEWKIILFVGTIHGLRPLEMYSDEMESTYSCSLYEQLKIVLKRTILKRYISNKYYKSFRKLFENEKFVFIAVSEHTKYSLCSFFPKLKNTNINVLYSPLEYKTISDDYNVNQIGKYYLLVSGNRWLKNVNRALLAFDQLFSEQVDLKGEVVVTGVKKQLSFHKRLKNKNRFIFKSYVSDEELVSLYKNAYAFLYPSLNEGFGYPPLEAMRFGVPVLTSPFSSICEICGDASLYFNPYSVSELKNRILQMEDWKLREAYSSKARVRFNYISNKQQEDLDKLVKYLITLETQYK